MSALAYSDDKPLGTAAWGNPDAWVMGAHNTGQFILGHQDSGQAVGLEDDRHLFMVSSTRGGKGTSVIMPNLITYPGSVVVIDPKGENAMVTARRRGAGNQFTSGMKQKVQILDPMHEVKTSLDDFSDIRASFNPLSLLHASRPESVEDAARIAYALIPGESAADPYWNITATDVLQMFSLHVATWKGIPDRERNLVKVFQLLLAGVDDGRLATLGDSKQPTPMQRLLLEMKRNHAFDNIIAQYAQRFLETPAKQFSAVLSVACAGLSFLKGSAMRACVSKSTFSLSELKTAKGGMSLYLCLPQRDIGTHYGWLRMMVSLIIAEMERIKEPPATRKPLLMVLDEFPALKRMTVIENAAAQIAGFGVKMVFVAQSLAQMKDIYKDNWETLLANCGAKLFFCNEDQFTREYVSRLIGEHEVIRTSVSQSVTRGRSSNQSATEGGSRGSSSTYTPEGFVSKLRSETWNTGKSWSESQSHGTSESATQGRTHSIHKRALLTPDEVGREFGSRANPRALVLLSGFQPIALNRQPYFRNQNLLGYFDYHRDHPVPPTRIEAKQLRADHQRKKQEYIEAKRRKAQEERYRRERAAEAEAMQKQAEAEERARSWAAYQKKQLIRRCIGVLIWACGALGYLYCLQHYTDKTILFSLAAISIVWVVSKLEEW